MYSTPMRVSSLGVDPPDAHSKTSPAEQVKTLSWSFRYS